VGSRVGVGVSEAGGVEGLSEVLLGVVPTTVGNKTAVALAVGMGVGVEVETAVSPHPAIKKISNNILIFALNVCIFILIPSYCSDIHKMSRDVAMQRLYQSYRNSQLSKKPRLRQLDFQPVTHQGEQMWCLRDPLELTSEQLIMPPVLAQLLLFCDGTRTPQQIHAAFCQHLGQQLDFSITEQALSQLDAAYLFDNERTQQAVVQQKEAYRSQPHRPPALADLSYPGNPQQLTRLLDNYSANDNLNGWEPWRGRAIISPHIDYQRGGNVYAKVWQRAKTAVLEADLILIFGTDHNGGLGTFTLTRQPYATPYGVLPTNTDVVDALAAAIGEDAAYAEELHHRREHSIELSAVWLHYITQQAGVDPKPMVPILCGSFHHFVMNGSHPAEDVLLETAVSALKTATAGKKVLAVASVDFAHVGPAFDDNYIMDKAHRAALRQADHNLVQAIIRGDDASFYEQITAVEDRNKICGFSSIYLMLRYLQATEGIQVAYDHCPADDNNHSLVSIAGILLE
jgi:MEMO1 family protein